jgi:hypothetical protein
MTAPQEHDVDLSKAKRAQPGSVKLYVSSSVLSLLAGAAAGTGTSIIRGGDSQELRDAKLRVEILKEVDARYVEKNLSDERWGRLGDTLEAQLRGIREELTALKKQTDPIPGLVVKLEMLERERGR